MTMNANELLTSFAFGGGSGGGSTPTGTKEITISQNGTTTEDVAGYAEAEITVDVPGNQRLLDFLAGRSDSEETKLTISDADFVNTGSTGNKRIGPYAFAGTTVEENVELDLSRTRRILHHAFFQMEIAKGLEIAADKVVSVEQSAFEGFKAGVSSGTKPTLALPRITSQIPYACFKDCTAFSAVDLGEGCGTINAMAFNGSTISEVVIRKTESRVPLGNVSAFANWTGTIYVPDALVDDYKSATNWSTYASSIEPLSNYNP